jgi:hypothetical protein
MHLTLFASNTREYVATDSVLAELREWLEKDGRADHVILAV